MIWQALAFIGCVLSIWNTVILWRRALIHKDDLRLLLDIVEKLATLTPGSANEKAIRNLRKIMEDHT